MFLIGSLWLGRLLSPLFVTLVNELKTRGQLLVSALIVAFILADIAAVIQLEAILGAFAAGLILAETEKRAELEEQIKPIADNQINATGLHDRELLLCERKEI